MNNLTYSQKKAHEFIGKKIEELESRKTTFLIGQTGIGKTFLAKKFATSYEGVYINLLDGDFLNNIASEYSLHFFNTGHLIDEIKKYDFKYKNRLLVFDGLSIILKLSFNNGFGSKKFIGDTFNSLNNNFFLFVVDTEDEEINEELISQWVPENRVYKMKIDQKDIDYISSLYKRLPHTYQNLYEVIKRSDDYE